MSCVVYTTQMEFGKYIRQERLALQQTNKDYSLRKVAQRIGVEPAYLSKIERGDFAPPSEKVIIKLAEELNQNPDVLLAMAGKLSSDLQAIIQNRPELFASLLRELAEQPDHAILKIVREVRDGDW